MSIVPLKWGEFKGFVKYRKKTIQLLTNIIMRIYKK